MTDDSDPHGTNPDAEDGVIAAKSTDPGRSRIDEAARRRLGRNLRLLYVSVLDQPLPERLTRLVEELGAKSRNREG